jgi:hypothetical protein
MTHAAPGRGQSPHKRRPDRTWAPRAELHLHPPPRDGGAVDASLRENEGENLRAARGGAHRPRPLGTRAPPRRASSGGTPSRSVLRVHAEAARAFGEAPVYARTRLGAELRTYLSELRDVMVREEERRRSRERRERDNEEQRRRREQLERDPPAW